MVYNDLTSRTNVLSFAGGDIMIIEDALNGILTMEVDGEIVYDKEEDQ